MTDTDAER